MLKLLLSPDSWASIGAAVLTVVSVLVLLGLKVAITLRRVSKEEPPPNGPIGLPPARGPAPYTVHGLDQTTGEGVTWRCTAESLADAKAQARAQGIVATSVQRED